MKGIGLRKRGISVAFGLVLVLAFAASGARAQNGAAGKKASEVFKNIQVLKDAPAEQLLPTMQFFEASLGVTCDFCHVEARDKDEKMNKVMARKMITMVRNINKDVFDSRREVTCYTCHRGSADPPGTPRVADADYRPWDPDSANGAEPPQQRPPVPPPDQIIDKYLQAIGGLDAVKKANTRVVKATVTDSIGRRFGMEILSKAPEGSILIAHQATGDVVTARTGDTGWFRAGNGAPRDIRPNELDDLRVQDVLYFVTHVKQSLTDLQTRPGDKVFDRDTWQVRGTWGKTPVRLFFGRGTGNLLRVVYLTQNAIGQNPTRIDFTDYREVNGVRFPFLWTIARPLGYQTVRIDQVQNNAPVDDAKFARPQAKSAS